MYAAGLVGLLIFPVNRGPIRIQQMYQNAPTATTMTLKATVASLIKTHEDVTPNTGREMNLSFQVELDTDGQRCSLQVAVVIDGALEEVACMDMCQQ